MNNPKVSIDGHEVVPENNEEALYKAVANQPVSVAIDANSLDMQFYSEVRKIYILRQFMSYCLWTLGRAKLLLRCLVKIKYYFLAVYLEKTIIDKHKINKKLFITQFFYRSPNRKTKSQYNQLKRPISTHLK